MPRWTLPALADMRGILGYIAADNSEAAQKVACIVGTATQNLDTFPHMGKPGREPATRELVLGRVSLVVVYRLVPDGQAEVLRVLHERQFWPPHSPNPSTEEQP